MHLSKSSSKATFSRKSSLTIPCPHPLLEKISFHSLPGKLIPAHIGLFDLGAGCLESPPFPCCDLLETRSSPSPGTRGGAHGRLVVHAGSGSVPAAQHARTLPVLRRSVEAALSWLQFPQQDANNVEKKPKVHLQIEVREGGRQGSGGGPGGPGWVLFGN